MALVDRETGWVIRFWRWLFGNPRPDRSQVLLEILIENQSKTTQAVMQAVSDMAASSQRQSEVLGAYLKLFQNQGDPESWVHDQEADNRESLLKMGFPANADEAEQAKWVLENIEKM